MAALNAWSGSERERGSAVFTSEREEQWIGFFAEICLHLGLPASFGGIYGVLFASEFPIAAENLALRLELDWNSVERGLKLLRSYGAIQKVEIPDDPRDFYTVSVHPRKLVPQNMNLGIPRKEKRTRNRPLDSLISDEHRLLFAELKKHWRPRKRMEWHETKREPCGN